MEELCTAYSRDLSVDRIRRFYRGCNEDVKSTRAMIDKHISWRKRNRVDEIRESVERKPFLLSSNPHASKLKQRGLGMMSCIVNAGRCRSNRDIVHIEVLGTDNQNYSENDPEWLEKIVQYYIGFFERRSLHLEELTKQDGVFVRSIQIRDVSGVNWVPGGSALSMVRRILNIGIENYPECGSCAIFLNPPKVFEKIFGLIRPWLPKGFNQKVKFLSGPSISLELMRYVRPATIVAMQRLLIEGEDGDEITTSLLNPQKSWQKTFNLSSFNRSEFLYVELSSHRSKCVTWYAVGDDQDTFLPFSGLTATLIVATQSAESKSTEDVKVNATQLLKGKQYATLPDDTDEALLVLRLANSLPWFASRSQTRIRIAMQECFCSRPEDQVLYLVQNELQLNGLGKDAIPSARAVRRFLAANNKEVVEASRQVFNHIKWRQQHLPVPSAPYAILDGGLRSRWGTPILFETVESLTALSKLTDDEFNKERALVHEHYQQLLDARDVEDSGGILHIVVVNHVENSRVDNRRLSRVLRRMLQLEFDHYPKTCASRLVVGNSDGGVEHLMTQVYKLFPEIKYPGVLEPISSHDEGSAATSLLRHVSPQLICDLNILPHILKCESKSSPTVQQKVLPGQRFNLFFALDEVKTQRASWVHVNAQESPKSLLSAKMFYVPRQHSKTQVTERILTSDSVELPHDVASDALVMLTFDHSASWVHPHEFHVVLTFADGQGDSL